MVLTGAVPSSFWGRERPNTGIPRLTSDADAIEVYLTVMLPYNKRDVHWLFNACPKTLTPTDEKLELVLAPPGRLDHSVWNLLSDFCSNPAYTNHPCMHWLRYNVMTYDKVDMHQRPKQNAIVFGLLKALSSPIEIVVSQFEPLRSWRAPGSSDSRH